MAKGSKDGGSVMAFLVRGALLLLASAAAAEAGCSPYGRCRCWYFPGNRCMDSSPPPPPTTTSALEGCELTVNMVDSFGDSWNGNVLDIYITHMCSHCFIPFNRILENIETGLLVISKILSEVNLSSRFSNIILSHLYVRKIQFLFLMFYNIFVSRIYLTINEGSLVNS